MTSEMTSGTTSETTHEQQLLLPRLARLEERAREIHDAAVAAIVRATQAPESLPLARFNPMRLRILAGELRSFIGALVSLATLGRALNTAEASSPLSAAHPNLSVLDDCESALDQAQWAGGGADQSNVKLGSVRAQLELAAEAYTSQSLLLALSKSIFASEPGNGVILPTRPDAPSRAVGLDDVRRWMRLLGRPEFATEPAEYAVERQRATLRSVQEPEYSVAARDWPLYANQFWADIEADAVALFAPEKRLNLVQLVLEHARHRWPDLLGWNAVSAMPAVKLTAMVCAPSLTPLDFAAVLGLPRLFQRLLPPIAPGHECGCIMSAQSVLCAVAGPAWFLLPYRGLAALDGAVLESKQARLEIIEFVARTAGGFSFLPTELVLPDAGIKVSMATVALSVSLALQEPGAFFKLVGAPDRIDSTFVDNVLLSPDRLRGRTDLNLLAEIATGIIDMVLPGASDGGLEYDVLAAVAKFRRNLDLPVVLTPSNNLLQDRSDEDYHEVVRWCLSNPETAAIPRLAADARWNPNATYSHPPDDNGFLLHLAAERPNTAEATIELLVRTGAHLEATDGEGRTPLLLSESPLVARSLIRLGCNTTACDKMGRNVWHYGAETYDYCLLKTLAAWDPNMSTNLIGINRLDNTPLAAAILGDQDRSVRPSDRVLPPRSLQVVRLLMALCEKENNMVIYASRWSLLHEAARFQEHDVLEGLMRAGLDASALDDQGHTVLHRLNITASAEVVRSVQEACSKGPVLTPNGMSAAETILHNMSAVEDETQGHLSEEAYSQLLAPRVVQSVNVGGECLWERFCHSILTRLGTNRSTAQFEQSVATAVTCLIRAGVVRQYEERADQCGLLPIIANSGRYFGIVPECKERLDIVLQVLRGATRTEGFAASPKAHLLLRAALLSKHLPLVERLINHGSSIFGGPGLRESPLEWIFLERRWPEEVMRAALRFERLAMRSRSGSEPDTALINRRKAISSALIHQLHDPVAQITDRERRLAFLVESGADPNSRADARPHAPALVSFILNGFEGCATLLLGLGADPLLTSDDGFDGIIAAACMGSVSVIEKMVACVLPSNFDWSSRTRPYTFHLPYSYKVLPASDASLMHLASFYGHELFLKYCVQNIGLDPEPRITDDGRTPMHLAALGALGAAGEACIEMLANCGADIDAVTESGITPLLDAVTVRNTEAVRALLGLGARQIPGPNGVTPFHLAFGATEEILSAFMARLPRGPSGQRIAPETASAAVVPTLSGLSRHGRARILGTGLQRTIESGIYADLETCLRCIPEDEHDSLLMDCVGCTPLMVAIGAMSRQNPAIVQLLLVEGFRGFTGTCRRHFSGTGAFNVLVEACRYRLGDDPKVFPSDDGTPKATMCFEFLLDACLENGMQWLDMAAESPLSVAVAASNVYATRTILEHVRRNFDKYRRRLRIAGLDPDPNYFRTRAESDEHQREIDGVIRSIVNHQGETNSRRQEMTVSYSAPLHDAVSFNASPAALAIVHVLLDNGADVDIRDSSLNTPLHLATQTGFTAAVETLLEHGADPNVENCSSHTPLTLAVMNDRLRIVEQLIRHGARTYYMSEANVNLLGLCVRTDGGPAMYDFLRSLDTLDEHHADQDGFNSVHDMVVNRYFSAYVFNSHYNLGTLRPTKKSFVREIIEHNSSYAGPTLERLFRRVGADKARALANAPTGPLSSALCHAVQTNDLACVRALVRWGVDLELDGSRHGTALMAACATGRFDMVKELVHAGAAFTYQRVPPAHFATTAAAASPAEPVFRSALTAALQFPAIFRWLLVGRHSSRLPLDQPPLASGVAAGEDIKANEKRWSGPRRLAYELLGLREECPRGDGESRRDFLERIHRVRRRLRGRVVAGTLVDEEELGGVFGDASVWCLELAWPREGGRKG